MNLKTGLFEAFDHFQPFRPNWIDQDINLMRLNQKGGVPDPSDADLSGRNLWKFRRHMHTGTLREKGRDKNLGQKITSVPVPAGTHFHTGRSFVLRTVLRRLANNIPSTLFRKRNRHFRGTI